jgi:hypothetical protein
MHKPKSTTIAKSCRDISTDSSLYTRDLFVVKRRVSNVANIEAKFLDEHRKTALREEQMITSKAYNTVRHVRASLRIQHEVGKRRMHHTNRFVSSVFVVEYGRETSQMPATFALMYSCDRRKRFDRQFLL